MTQAYQNFQKAMDEITDLNCCCSVVKNETPYNALRVLKRAILILVLTAWETYVEDVAEELLLKKLSLLNDSQIGSYVHKSFRETHKRFNTPDSQNTKRLFEDFLGVDVTESWVWNNFDHEKVRSQLNKWVEKRGEAVHRISVNPQDPDVAKIDDLRKCLSFFTELAKATETALEKA